MNATLNIPSAASAAQSAQRVLGGALTRLSGLVAQIGTAIREEYELQRAINDLSELNERQLRDIGLIRSDIEAAVRGQPPVSR